MWGTSRIVCVVDNRTYRKGCKQVQELEDDGQYRWAYAGAVAITVWLRDQVQHGRKSKRPERAAALEQWELRAEQLKVLNLRDYGLA